MKDVLSDPNDKIETEPPELGPIFVEVMTTTLSKHLADQYKKPWTPELENKLQQAISQLVSQATLRGLATIKVIVTKPNGQRAWRNLDIAMISRERKLQ